MINGRNGGRPLSILKFGSRHAAETEPRFMIDGNGVAHQVEAET
jgi:hypothetical protein